jgi:hypothetical protein
VRSKLPMKPMCETNQKVCICIASPSAFEDNIVLVSGGGSETRLETHDASTAVGTDLPPPQSSHSEPEAVKLSISTAE